MRLEKMDSIVCNALTSQSLPVHFYLKFLNYGINCLRELKMDVMRNVIPVRLKLNSYKAAKLPCDYVDFVVIGIQVGQYVKRLPQKKTLNRLKNFDDNGTPEQYPDVRRPGVYPFSYSWPRSWNDYLWTVNDKGENKGRLFGFGGGSFRMSYKIIKEREEIQFDTDFPCDEVYMEYISDGFDNCGCDTMIHPYAYDTIKNYILWQYFLNTKKLMKIAPLWERQFDTSAIKLRGRMNDLTPEDVIMTLRKNTKASIHN